MIWKLSKNCESGRFEQWNKFYLSSKRKISKIEAEFLGQLKRPIDSASFLFTKYESVA